MNNVVIPLEPRLKTMVKRIRYNIRTLLGLMLIIGLASAILTNRFARVAHHNKHLHAIASTGADYNIEFDRRTIIDRVFWFGPFKYHHVKSVLAENVGEFDDATLEHVLALPELEILEMGNTSITDKALEHVVSRDPPCLRVLNLNGAGISDDGLYQLTQLEQLTDIWISNCNQITEQGIHRFRTLRPPGTVRLHR